MRAVSLAVLLVLLTLGAAACGDDDEAGDPTPPTTAPPTTSVAETSIEARTTSTEATSVADDSAAPGPGTEVPAAGVESRLEELFAPIAAAANGAGTDAEPGIVWTMALTPPLPDQWPPTPETQWVRWAYAHGMEAGLADAVRVARVWGNAVLMPGSPTARVIVIYPQLSAWPEPQGFRPLSSEESADRAKLGDASALALQLTSEPDDNTAELLRRTYGGWVADNGVILQSLPDAHDPFLEWLAEEPVR